MDFAVTEKGEPMPRYIDADKLIKTIRDNDYLVVDYFNSKDRGMFTAGIMQAIDEQPSAQPEPHWIPCSERLPEHNQICIVTDETRRCAYEYGIHDETYDDVNGWTYLGHRIIAWMPLPEPYTENDDA